MLLRPKLDEARRRFELEAPAAGVAAIRSSVATICEAGMLDRALKAGDVAPAFTLQDAPGSRFDLYHHLAHGPVVISFLRGIWCPFCALELEALAQVHDGVAQLGARLVAITPAWPGTTEPSCDANCAPFPVLADASAKVARKFGLTFQVPLELRPLYVQFGHPEAANGTLPIPATYVIERGGRIALSYLDPDFTTRFEPADILVALTCLRERAAPQPVT